MGNCLQEAHDNAASENQQQQLPEQKKTEPLQSLKQTEEEPLKQLQTEPEPLKQKALLTATSSFEIYAKNGRNCDLFSSGCDYLNRLISGLNYFWTLNKASDSFTQFFTDIYPQILDDYTHFVTTHNHQLDDIYDALMIMDNKNECSADKCICLKRYYNRDRNRNINDDMIIDESNENKKDPLFMFYCDTFDSAHHYLYHLYDVGMRVKNVNDEIKINNDSNDEYNIIDYEFGRMRKIISDKRKLVNRTNDRSSNKFNINVSPQNNIQENKGEKTFIDAFFDHLKKGNVCSTIDLNMLHKIIYDESYDTETLLEDINIDNDDITHTMNGSNILRCIKKSDSARYIKNYIKNTQLGSSSFSTGVIWYYWPYYENLTEIDQTNFRNINDHSGFNYAQLFVAQKYSSFKQEILKHIPIKQYNELVLLKAQQYMISEKVKSIEYSESLYLHYRINRYTEPISIDHLMCIILYCDFSAFCSEFSSTFRQITTHEPLVSMKKRNREYWFMSKLLRESTELFGHGSNENYRYSEKGPFYSGLNTVMIIPCFRIRLCSPTSTSKQITVAINFCKSQGIVMQLNNTRLVGSYYLKMFDCSWLSSYKEEDERIFIGGYMAIRIESIRKLDELNQWQNFHRFFHAFDIVDSMISGFKLQYLGWEINVYENDVKVINKLLDGSFDSFDPYIANCWKNYIFNKIQITINMDELYIWNFCFDNPLEKQLVSNFMTSIELNTKVYDLYVNGKQFPDCTNSTNNLISSTIFTTFPHIHEIIILTTGESGDRTYAFCLIKFLDIICSLTASSWNRITIRALRPHNKKFKSFGNWIHNLWKSSSEQLIATYSKQQLNIELFEGQKSCYSALEDWLVITREQT